jgi:acetyl-CoA carboxylase biotin carboxyl carrier protein
MLKINELIQMIKMVEESSIQRFEHERIVIVKNEQLSSNSPIAESDAPIENKDVSKVKVVSEIKTDAAENLHADRLHKIHSPIVGTFYSAPEPGAEPFVKIGQHVDSKTVVGVLEAMKLFNEVEAGVSGEVVEILVKDNDFVNFGQLIFVIKVGT